ncbi:MAG: hypothetical protein A3J76_00980 [Candidatus Moranbacteria bacterium RBG_13_45_13]|nr:MAG: hypothetical protein A3J76_00980 [Candidatus Moranbacteria bacterium RBG_13_45_13]
MKTQNEIKNKLILGDNLEILKTLKDESVDLIYIDPPFFSNKNYEVVFGDEAEIRSFEDRWEGGVNVYVEWMRDRVKELYRVLKPTGSFYLHCDWHASHHLRVMLDEVFGENNFRNEIIWCYRGAGYPKKDFGKRHDTIFRYSKTDDYVFNLDDVREEYAEATKERFSHYIGNIRKGRNFGLQKLNPLGKQPDDWWQIQPVAPSASERLGYPTQKPEALLEKIIKASSNKDDIILDSFCGCGTSLAVAQKLGRHWIGIDISPTAIKLVEKRLNKLGTRKDNTYITINTPTTDNDLRAFKPFEFQNWVIDELGAKHSKVKSGDFGLDGYFEKDLWHEKAGVQVKQSDSVGRNVVDNFETALKRAKYDRGYIIAFSFSRGAYEEVARVKKEGLEMKLIKVSELLNKKKPIL